MISYGGIVVSNSARVAGDAIDEAIVEYIKRKYKVLIGDVTAEELKKNLASAIPQTDRGYMEARGRNLVNGLPAILTIRSGEVREAIREQVADIVNCICTTLEQTPPELSSDIYDMGIVVTGGGALISGLPQLISQVTGIRVLVAKNPLDSVAVGIGHVIEADLGSSGYRNR